MKKTIKTILLAMLTIVCLSSVEIKAQNATKRKEIGEKYFGSFFNAKSPEIGGALVDKLVADDFVDYAPFFGNTPDKAGFKKTVASINAAFEEKYVVDKVIIEKDIYVAIWHSDAKHIGEFMGVPATNKEFRVTGITIYKIVNGKIKAHWEQFDVVTMMKALGMMKE